MDDATKLNEKKLNGKKLDDTTVDRYLERIGAARPEVLDAAALDVLHRAHLLAVPFENLSLHLSEPVSLEPADLIDKIVTRRRGGFCYELNGAFALLLRTLGAEVSLAAVMVYDGDRLGPPFDHLALLVRPAGGGRRLVDVGFGDHSVHSLDLDDRQEQDDPAGRFQLIDTDPVPATDPTATPTGDLDLFRDGKPRYRVELRPRSLTDFGPTCWYQQTSPQSHFTRQPVCSLLTEDGPGQAGPGGAGRITLSGRTLIRTENGTRIEQELTTDAAVLAAYRDQFGVVLERVPDVSPAGP
jgi:N-hydroxyarylamine O-acetyltransferase